MIDRREILAAAGSLGLLPNVVEKDYVLGWLLAGIYAHPSLAEHWVFKGGTCLKKCYFETYRFSEDLDFTLTDPALLDQTFLIRAFREVSAWVYDETGIELPADRLHFEVFDNPPLRGFIASVKRGEAATPPAPDTSWNGASMVTRWLL